MQKQNIQCVFSIALLLFEMLFVYSIGCAEIACECNDSACSCFVQIGDEGIAVQGAIDLLAEQGYLSSARGNTFDHDVYEALCAFQDDHALQQSGMLDHETLTMLIWGQAQPSDDGVAVWVPTDGGKKRHKKPTCSNMLDPRKMASVNAQALGIEACKRCKPQ